MDLIRLQSEIDMTGRISERATRQLIAEVEHLREALEWIRRNGIYATWRAIATMIDKALKGGE